MHTNQRQRWRDGVCYQPTGDTIDTRLFEVAAIPDDTTAKAFVLAHHYSGSYPAARRRFGIYRRAELQGVAVFSVPANPRTLACVPGDRHSCCELGRFVLLDDVPANGESWFLARCFALLKAESFTGVVSFSDPLRRRDAAGRSVFGGHVGTIYQATNACYIGRGTARTLRLLPDGSVFSARALSKLRAGHQGWRYAASRLEAHGATPLADDASDEQRRNWARRWTRELTRGVRHRGNHKYAWALARRDRRHLPPSQPYPKLCD